MTKYDPAHPISFWQALLLLALPGANFYLNIHIAVPYLVGPGVSSLRYRVDRTAKLVYNEQEFTASSTKMPEDGT
jgi:hypothetical protein